MSDRRYRARAPRRWLVHGRGRRCLDPHPRPAPPGQEGSILRREALREAAAGIEARTPTGRDRYADLVRVVAILLVVLGHWLVAVVTVDDGRFVATQLLAVEPWTQWATWVWQVMPLFFLVGGRVNAGSLRRALERGDPWWWWVRRRARRLLRPMVPLLAVWVLLGPALEAFGLSTPMIERATEVAFMPLWFLVVYTLVILAAPASWWLHRRGGWWVLLAATALVATIDALVTAGVPMVGVVNHLLVFAIAHQVGYLWVDDRLPRGAGGPLLTAAGILWAVLMVTVADYPVSMVGVEGPTPSNATPPNLALVALALAQTGLLVTLRAPADRWLHRSALAWAAVASVGAAIITIFLWHMSALVAAAAATHLTGWWPDVEPTTAGWWALRPGWVLVCTAALVALVLAARRTERVGEPGAGGPLATILGAGAAAGGLYVILESGLYDPQRSLRVPVIGLVLLLGGLVLLGVLVPRLSVPAGGTRRSGAAR